MSEYKALLQKQWNEIIFETQLHPDRARRKKMLTEMSNKIEITRTIINVVEQEENEAKLMQRLEDMGTSLIQAVKAVRGESSGESKEVRLGGIKRARVILCQDFEPLVEELKEMERFEGV